MTLTLLSNKLNVGKFIFLLSSLLGGELLIGHKTKKLLDVLVAQGKVKREDSLALKNLTNAQLEQNLRLGGVLSSEELARAYAEAFGMPYISLKAKVIPKETLEMMPEKLVRDFKIVPYESSPGIIRIAVSEPGKLTEDLSRTLEKIREKRGIKVEVSVTTPEDFNEAVLQYQKLASTSQSPQQPVNIPVLNEEKENKPGIDFNNIQIAKDTITKFPEDIARKYKIVVFDAPHPSFIKVAVVNPDDPKVREILDFVKEKNDISIEEHVVAPDIIEKLMRFYNFSGTPQIAAGQQATELKAPKPGPPSIGPKQNVSVNSIKKEEPQAAVPEVTAGFAVQNLQSPAQSSFQESDLDAFIGQQINSVTDLQNVAQTGNVPHTLAASIALAAKKKASDVHFEPTDSNLRVRYRVDGILRDIIKLPVAMHPPIMSRIKILSKLKIDESRVPQDGRFEVKTSGHEIDLRVSTLPTVHGEKAALRLLDKSARIYTLEEIGLAGKALKTVIENIDKPYGVVLSTGPTGSGKSTTLYAILSRISTASVNIITLEDPVEYEIPGINQCQIRPKIGFTFANGLRSVLRQDPNIIMVGEIRDGETASLATHAALTGHLVLSTLHTNDASGTLPRLINMGIEPFLITSSVNVIIGQRLVRKLCQKCKIPAHIPAPIEKDIEKELSHFNFPKPYKFYEARGCPECDQGYKGRIGIFEVMEMTDEIESLAINRRPSQEIKETAVKQGMATMKQDGLIKALKGITTVNEVLRVITI